MPLPLASPGNHQSWYLLRRVIASLSTTRTHLNNRSGRYAVQYYTSLSFISVDAPYKKPIPLKSFLWIFPYPNFIKKPMGFDVPNGVNIKVRTVYLTFQILLQFQDPQSDHQVLLTFFWGSVVQESQHLRFTRNGHGHKHPGKRSTNDDEKKHYQ